jgi:hypothetical protein
MLLSFHATLKPFIDAIAYAALTLLFNGIFISHLIEIRRSNQVRIACVRGSFLCREHDLINSGTERAILFLSKFQYS